MSRLGHGVAPEGTPDRAHRRAPLLRTATATLIAAGTALVVGAAPATGAEGEGEKRARMKLTEATPRKAFADDDRKARFEFELAGETKRTLVVKVKKLSDGKTKRRWRLRGVKPGERQTITWNGKTADGGFTGQGKHVFRVYEAGAGKTDMSDAKGRKRFRFYKHRFPVRAKHTYGDGYGAGRGHQGVDVFSRCGKSIRAVRGGRVQLRASHGSAGRYLVIDGHGTGRDYVYMHMKRRGRPKQGERVRTGEKIGYVGATGNAVGCHLHFEVWSAPGWYEGGSPARNIKSMVMRWDGWS